MKHGPLEEFLDRYIWTGGPTPLPEGGPKLLRVERLLRVGIWTYIRATFKRPLFRGDIYDFEIRWPSITNWRNSSPFVSTSTEEPTYQLSFELTIPSREIGGTTILAEQLRGIEATFPFRTREIPFVNGHCVWTVKRPPLCRHFRLRWEWTGSVQTVSKALESSAEA